MTAHVGLVVARMHGRLVSLRGSEVFHVYSGSGPLTPSGRWVSRAGRTVCGAGVRRRLWVLRRRGVVVELGGLRPCARCWASLTAQAATTEAPPANVDARKAYYDAAKITSTDLVTWLTVCSSVAETRTLAMAVNDISGPVTTVYTVAKRPAAGPAQRRFDFDVELLALRRRLAIRERTADEQAVIDAKNAAEAERTARIADQRRADVALDNAIARREKNQHLMPHQRALLDSA